MLLRISRRSGLASVSPKKSQDGAKGRQKNPFTEAKLFFLKNYFFFCCPFLPVFLGVGNSDALARAYACLRKKRIVVHCD